MANYYGKGRTNYVSVTDRAAFEDAAGKLNCTVIDNSDGKVGLMDANDDGGGFFFQHYDEVADDYVDYDPAELIAPLLLEGEVIVFEEVGFEKYRYLSGWAFAFDRSGEVVRVSLDDIFQVASDKFGVPVAQITDATY